MRNKFTFGGRSTEEFSMRIEKFPAIKAPARRRKAISVPGRSGALYQQEDAFDNYTQPYECYFHSSLSAVQQAHAVKAWLLRSGTYQKLEDTYDPTHYRMATFAGPMDIENTFNKYGRCVINFDCAPQSFLVSGDFPCLYETPGAIFNPTAFPASPLVTVYGTGGGTVTLGQITVQILSITDQLILDCDLQHAYRQSDDGVVENCNGFIYAPRFPQLQPGDNSVEFTGDISKIEIIPRWWEL